MKPMPEGGSLELLDELPSPIKVLSLGVGALCKCLNNEGYLD